MSSPIRKKEGPATRAWGARSLIVVLLCACLFVTLGTGALIVGYLSLGLPDIESLKRYRPPVVTEVLDKDFRPLAYWYEERRWYVPLDRMPRNMIHAILAAEDARFYEHPGIDFLGVIRAVLRNVEAGGIVQGASTITQQVTRALLLTPEKSWVRKIKEAVLAWQIDGTLTKDEILAIYLNQIYFGHGAYGVEAAARTYFNKHAMDLSLAECALIAGLPQAPSRYDPFRNLEAARARQHYVLRRMAEEGFISADEAAAAASSELVFQSEELLPPPGSGYFLTEVRKDLEARYGRKRLLTDGLTVVTTLDSEWQYRAHTALVSGIEAVLKRHPRDKDLAGSLQGALVAMELETGAVRALVGGRDFGTTQFNFATQGRMQPGSAFKPIVYAAAMARRAITPRTVLMDEPVAFPGSGRGDYWRPSNFDGQFLGPITVRTALTLSRNVISVKIADMIGTRPIADLAHAMGVTVPLAQDLTLSLGSTAVPLSQMVQAYSAFPNGGKSVEPRFIRYVRDQNGRILENMRTVRHEALDPVTAYQMVSLLQGVVREGTGAAARALGVPCGGKTGTSNDFRDAWFIGFTPEIVAGVWVGREDRKPIGTKETGGRVACPIWTDFMSVTRTGSARANFPIPAGVAIVQVDKETGMFLDPDMGDVASQSVWEVVRDEELTLMERTPSVYAADASLEGSTSRDDEEIRNRGERGKGIPGWIRRLDDFFFR